MDFDINWFRKNVAYNIQGYSLEYKRFTDPEGSEIIDRIEIESKSKGCEIEFYSSGKLYLFLYDYINEEEIINVLLMQNQPTEKEKVFKQLQKLLK